MYVYNRDVSMYAYVYITDVSTDTSETYLCLHMYTSMKYLHIGVSMHTSKTYQCIHEYTLQTYLCTHNRHIYVYVYVCIH